MPGHLRNAAISIYYLVLFLSNSIIVIITLGAPYLHYKLYRHDRSETYSSEKYYRMVQALSTLWDQYSDFLLHILPVLFPMISSSGLPLCSMASFMATMTFVAGIASIATRIIFKIRVKALQNEHTVNEWLKAFNPSWLKVPNKSFWTLLSLPTVIFFSSVGLLISTVMLTFWERSVTNTTPSPETQGCSIKKLHAFKYTPLAALVTTLTS